MGNPYCPYSTRSTNSAEKKHWKNCNACGCMNQWLYKQTGASTAEVRHRCFDDPVWGAKWCYVEGFAHCKSAKASEVAGENRHYIKCSRETCGHHKNVFKKNMCCGAPTKKWPLQDIH